MSSQTDIHIANWDMAYNIHKLFERQRTRVLQTGWREVKLNPNDDVNWLLAFA
jgi:hypothetical protein